MKKVVSIILITLSAFMILDSLNIGHSIALFLLAGLVPGTNIIVSPIDMMSAFATAFTVVVLRLTIWPSVRNIFRVVDKKPSTTKRTAKQN